MIKKSTLSHTLSLTADSLSWQRLVARDAFCQKSSPWGLLWPLPAQVEIRTESNMLIKHHRYLRGAEREAYMCSDFHCVCWSVWFQSFAECWHGPKPRPTGVNYRTTPLAFPSLWLAIFIWARKHPGGRVCVCVCVCVCIYIHRFDGALFIRVDWDAEIDDSYYSFGLHRHTVFGDGQN